MPSSALPSHFEAPEDAYRGFFRADNAKDPDGWAAVMSYPHVRVSATGRTVYFDTPEQYAARASWAPREATGWVRSQGVDPARLHESADKVHLLGGWTRYNAKSEPILSNRVTYVLTRPKASWGIQARFGVDSFTGNDDGNDVEGTASTAVDLVDRFVASLSEGRFGRCADLCRLPLILVGVGEVYRVADAGGVEALLAARAESKARIRDIRAVQSGTDGAVVAVTAGNPSGATDHGVMVVGRQDERWEIAGISLTTGGSAPG